MNLQERIQTAFDLAVAGLASQGWQQSLAVNPKTGDMHCAYNGWAGRHCAYYYARPGLSFEEGYSAEAQLHNAEEPADLLTFYNKLQASHDWGRSPEEMQRKLLDLGYLYNLTIPPELHTCAVALQYPKL